MINQYSLKNFLPLIIIFSIILLLTTGRQLLMHTRDVHAFMYDFMGLFFIVFGSFKLYNLKAFANAYQMYDLIAQQSKLYAYLYPFIEVTLGICYIMRYQLPIINIITLILMLISAAGVAYALSKKEEFTCACLGALFKIPMTYVTLIEDLLMGLMAFVMLFK